MIDPEGSIGPHTLVDIVIRHTMPTSGNCNVSDKFRISMQDHATKQVRYFIIFFYRLLYNQHFL